MISSTAHLQGGHLTRSGSHMDRELVMPHLLTVLIRGLITPLKRHQAIFRPENSQEMTASAISPMRPTPPSDLTSAIMFVTTSKTADLSRLEAPRRSPAPTAEVQPPSARRSSSRLSPTCAFSPFLNSASRVPGPNSSSPNLPPCQAERTD